eukprot:CAMPEP_0174342496 /NCGR_PEP_ID=MMETSP0810-20121108/26221_1 /TAXON_ID=73025 ORGANISM="Eutreptiella gymnastica-like, Strain CCMP1594" /NCGR_SAMPLE_ID=MMETSP0810 /ASSEMBLY_ACC=CAM_ASM_000659 /LENGTH=47 /DNA_ID= /DNA_START= /DNA_END= /DNA_ORIENTATION=
MEKKHAARAARLKGFTAGAFDWRQTCDAARAERLSPVQPRANHLHLA